MIIGTDSFFTAKCLNHFPKLGNAQVKISEILPHKQVECTDRDMTYCHTNWWRVKIKICDNILAQK